MTPGVFSGLKRSALRLEGALLLVFLLILLALLRQRRKQGRQPRDPQPGITAAVNTPARPSAPPPPASQLRGVDRLLVQGNTQNGHRLLS